MAKEKETKKAIQDDSDLDETIVEPDELEEDNESFSGEDEEEEAIEDVIEDM